MKITHRRNIKRRKEKFGYTSNSTIGLDLAEIPTNEPTNESEFAEFE